MFRKIRNFFRSVNPHPAPHPNPVECGFRWTPNTPIQNFNVVKLDKNDQGLYVGLDSSATTPNPICFESPQDGVGILFEPLTISNQRAREISRLSGVTDDNLLQRLQGFLSYTNVCLNEIYATNPGAQLLNTLMHSQSRTIIYPGTNGNEYRTVRNSYCLVSDTIINNKFTVNVNQTALRGALTQATGTQLNDNEKFEQLANIVNSMPLYSLFVAENAYAQQFLQNHAPINEAQLQQWFENGDNCDFVQYLNGLPAVEGVPILNFVRLAVIVTLYPHSQPSIEEERTRGTLVYFSVWDLANNTYGEEDFNAIRPPAVGLAHELVHAFYVAQGKQPGHMDSGYSTTLTELICVGLGPFTDNPVSENTIRAAWPPANVPQDDILNNVNVERRDPYDDPALRDTTATVVNSRGPYI
jgi:hypothetical protein